MHNETEIVLANLDWLILHEGMKLDFASRSVTLDGEPYYVLDDLAVPGLTPATANREGYGTSAICTETATSSMLPRPWEANHGRSSDEIHSTYQPLSSDPEPPAAPVWDDPIQDGTAYTDADVAFPTTSAPLDARVISNPPGSNSLSWANLIHACIMR